MSINSVPMQPQSAYPYFEPLGAPQAAGTALNAAPVGALPTAAPALGQDQFQSTLSSVQQQAQAAIGQVQSSAAGAGVTTSSMVASGAGIAQTAAPYVPGAVAGHHAARTLSHTYGNNIRRTGGSRTSGSRSGYGRTGSRSSAGRSGRSNGYRTSSGRSSSYRSSGNRVSKVKGYTRWENGKLEHVQSHTTSAGRSASRMRSNSYGRSTGRSAGRLRSASSGAMQSGASGLFSDVLRGVRDSAIVNGVISVAVNGYKLSKGQETKGAAAANVTGDLASGVVGGAVGAVTSAVGTSLLAGVLGSGLMLSVAGIGLGIGGYMIADHFLRKTSFFQNLTGSVQRMFGG